jgi:hypothetical protein
MPSPDVPPPDVPSLDLPSPDLTVADAGTIDTLLAFLTTSCASCQPFWEMMAEGPITSVLGSRLVVVTPSPSMEDERRARRLVPPGVHLHMGSGTWFDYGIGKAASFVLVRSSRDGPPPWLQPGRVLGAADVESPAELLERVRRWQAAAGP